MMSCQVIVNTPKTYICGVIINGSVLDLSVRDHGFDLIRFIVFNATFSYISAKSWRPVLLVEEAGVPGENH